MTARASVATLKLPRPVPSVLAVGALLKNTVCMTRGDEAFLSAPIGNLDSREVVLRFDETVRAMRAELGVEPAVVAHDLHPDYHSTRFARGLGIPMVPVQHHHAHVAAVAAEYGVVGPLLGIALDGFGLGPGNEAWGGELLLVRGADYRRLGHLAPLPQPGGDVAAREPWRMAAAALHRLGRGEEIAKRFRDQRAAVLLGRVIARGVNSPPTSSAGRLFDAACGLLGVHPVARFEGQAPMALEAMVSGPEVMADGWSIEGGVLDTLPLLGALADSEPERGANLFHGTLIAALADWAGRAAEAHGIGTVALSGGCFFNKVLTGGLVAELDRRGLKPLLPERISPGDPGVSLGQAWVAALADA